MPKSVSFDEPDLLRERIAQRTERTDGCWIWTGAMYAGPNSYPVIAVDRKNLTVHRVVWRLEHGAIPDGFCICHHCDNRRCVRLEHLFLGTYGDNSADMVAKKRSAKGERVNRAKLTEDDVRQIRAAHVPRSAGGYGSVRDLARQFGVDASNIHNILQRKTWRHVP